MGALQDLQDKYGFSDEEAEQLQDELSPKQLRDHVKRLESEVKDLPALRSFKETTERRPQVEKAFQDAGLDWKAVDQMPPWVRQQVEAFDKFGDANKVAEFIQQNRLPMAQQQQQQQPGQQGQGQQGLPQHPAQGQVIPAQGSPAQQVVEQAMQYQQQAPGQQTQAQQINDATSEEEVMKLVRDAGLPVAGED